jgi:zinc D-Ala-D-Ala carboxypeptidase
MNPTSFFTLELMTFSNTAKAEGIDNQPPPAEVESPQALCTAVLDPLREEVGQPIKVTSGYRGPALNRRVEGAAKSQHLVGQAAATQSPGMAVIELFKTVIRLGLPYDQTIYDVNGASKWVYVPHNPGPWRPNRVTWRTVTSPTVRRPRPAPNLSRRLHRPRRRGGGHRGPLHGNPSRPGACAVGRPQRGAAEAHPLAAGTAAGDRQGRQDTATAGKSSLNEGCSPSNEGGARQDKFVRSMHICAQGFSGKGN